MDAVLQRATRYFSANAPEEIMAEIRPYLCGTDTSLEYACKTLYNFLPTHPRFVLSHTGSPLFHQQCTCCLMFRLCIEHDICKRIRLYRHTHTHTTQHNTTQHNTTQHNTHARATHTNALNFGSAKVSECKASRIYGVAP